MLRVQVMRFLALALVLVAAPAAAAPPQITADELGPTAVAALAAADVTHAAQGGAELVARSADSTDLVATRQRLDQAIAAAGLTVVDDGGAGAGIRLTVEDARGARALIVQDARGGSITVVARPRTATPPGPCVAVPQPVWEATVHASGIDQSGESHQRDIRWRLTTTRMLDVDGDAVLDAWVPLHGARQCPEDGRQALYVMRGTCGHLVGKVGPGWLTPDAGLAPLDRSGYRPLTFEQEQTRFGARGIPEMVRSVRRYRFRGRAYVARAPRVTVGVCHHCATWHCTTP